LIRKNPFGKPPGDQSITQKVCIPSMASLGERKGAIRIIRRCFGKAWRQLYTQSHGGAVQYKKPSLLLN
jgi:hypothetical protein